MLNIDLHDKSALVIGGSRGIGAGITAVLARAGARVYFTHRGRPPGAAAVDRLVSHVTGQGGVAVPLVADAGSPADANRAVAEVVQREKRVDALVCNVGQTLARPVEQITDESWHDLIEINLSSAFYAVRAVLPGMIERGYGRIVMIGSSAIYDGGGGAVDYAASKAGLCGMMMHLTRNYTRRGILTNVVHPCVIDTDLLRERYDDEPKRQQLIAQVPAGRLGTPEDIAQLVAFLLSPFGDFICGQSILVDGGRTIF